MRKRTTFLALWCLLFAWPAAAQQGQLQRIREHMQLSQYERAIERCHKILRRQDNYEAKVYLAKAYRKTHQYEAAEKWYAEVTSTPGCAPEYYYYYGLTLLQNGRCVAADSIFEQYLEQRPRDHRSPHLRQSCEYRRQLETRHLDKYQLFHLDFNSPQNDFGAAFYQDGLVFASDRHGQERVRGPFLDLYWAGPLSITSTGLSGPIAPAPFSEALNSRWHEAMAAFNSEQTVVYLTRSRKVEKRSRRRSINPLEVVYARQLEEGGWSELRSLPFNSDHYSVAHPTLVADGKGLFFSSDMPGGFGGTDIYFSRWNNGHWSWPENLGAAVNTGGDELFPFCTPGGQLYFASDGHPGLGGLDIYSIEWAEGAPSGRPTNLGFPINTRADDFGLVYDRTRNLGLFTSNREGGRGGDDLYAFRRTEAVVRTQLADADTGEPLEKVTVTHSCSAPSVRDLGGGRWMVEITAGQCCSFTFRQAGYEPRTVELCAGTVLEADRSTVRIELTPRTAIAVQGRVRDARDGKGVEEASVLFIGPEGEVLRQIRTDEEGVFFCRLVVDPCFTVEVQKSGFLPQKTEQRYCPDNDHAGLEIFLAPTVPALEDGVVPAEAFAVIGEKGPAAFERQYRKVGEDSLEVFLVDVHYEFDRTSVRREDYPELEKLLAFLRENPDLSIEITSYTDARGDSIYNWKLSHRRVAKIVSWLIGQGIDPGRLVGRGYGEDRLLNHCDDGVECTEAEHQVNRRTEFRILSKM